jgi:hypothetical protein
MMSICLFKIYSNNFSIRNFYTNGKTKIFIYPKLNIWKFGDDKHYSSLKLLTSILGILSPKDDIDGIKVAAVYYEEKNLERSSFGFHGVNLKRYTSYLLGGKNLPFYVDLGYLDAWIVPYLVEVKEEKLLFFYKK